MTDRIDLLNDKQLVSFGFIPIVGAAGNGKTTVMMKLHEKYLQEAKEDVYDFKDPMNIRRAGYTHLNIISPTYGIDATQ